MKLSVLLFEIFSNCVVVVKTSIILDQRKYKYDSTQVKVSLLKSNADISRGLFQKFEARTTVVRFWPFAKGITC